MRRVVAFVLLLCSLTFLPLAAQAKAGRYDEQILQDVNKIHSK